MVIDEMPFDAMAFDETTFHDKASYEEAFKILLPLIKTDGIEFRCWKNGFLQNVS
jgi:hypothetical protein